MGNTGEKYYEREDVITSSGKYHRPFCHVLRNVANYNRKRLQCWKDAQTLGLQPCGLCKPYSSPASTLSAGSFVTGQGTVAAAAEKGDELTATAFADIKTLHEESMQRQDALISQMERFVELMKSTDRASCEQELRARFHSVWGKLSERVRSLLLASEQKYRIYGYAAPAEIVAGLATAFELQLQHTILTSLFAHLKDRKVKSLRPPDDWPDIEDRQRPLWSSTDKAEKCTLGTARLILRHPLAEIAEFFKQFGYDLESVRRAIESVYPHQIRRTTA
jgi:hypothetical protein